MRWESGVERLNRFGDHRYIGTRDDMRFFDCDDPEEFSALADRVKHDDLFARNLLQAFSPDEPSEARNRGFHEA